MQTKPYAIVKPRWGVVTAAWCIAAAIYTPAVWMVNQGQGQSFGVAQTIVLVALSFVPWALMTRPLIGICAYLPVGTGRTGRSLTLLALVGVVIVPSVTFIGNGAGNLLVWALGIYPPRSLEALLNATAITSLFSLPFYAAIVAVGQTLIWFERTRRSEQLLVQARLDALRAQINPHFLFNALYAVGELTHDNPSAAQEGLRRLSGVLRATLANDSTTVPLKSEIAGVKDQVELHRLLIPAQLEMDLKISPSAWSAKVPTLILQPLVENAFVHGIARMSEGAWLKIGADAQHGRLKVRVENARPTQSPPSRGLGLGLANVRERLRASYGDRASMDVKEASGSFAVEISIPLQTSNDAVSP